MYFPVNPSFVSRQSQAARLHLGLLTGQRRCSSADSASARSSDRRVTCIAVDQCCQPASRSALEVAARPLNTCPQVDVCQQLGHQRRYLREWQGTCMQAEERVYWSLRPKVPCLAPPSSQ